MKKTLICLFLAVVLSISAFAAFEKTNTYQNNFNDVPETSWYAENVKTAYELGFMNGKAEGKFDPSGNVTVAEGITMASRIHAIYNGVEITKKEKNVEAYVLDFGTEVTHSYKPNQATGEVVDGVYVLTPFEVPYGNGYDPGLVLENLNLPARDYTKAVIKFKMEDRDNRDTSVPRSPAAELFFATDRDQNLSESKKFSFDINPFYNNEDGWYYVELDLTSKDEWKDNIIQMRFDPTNNNGLYEIASISFMKNEEPEAEKWYDMYLDYASDNGICSLSDFDSFTRNITRAELAYLFAAAVPESEFPAINSVSAIPDVEKNDYYADTLLMLYNAGIVLGSDGGKFKPNDDIKRNETAAIINRVALPENRVKGTVDAVYDSEDYQWDAEFVSEDEMGRLAADGTLEAIKDGYLYFKSVPSTATKTGYDPGLAIKNLSVDATEYSKIKIRFKYDFYEGQDVDYRASLYFTTEENPELSEKQAYHFDLLSNSYVDAAGWTVTELNMALATGWTGNVTLVRFDPTNYGGDFVFDYVRFVKTLASTKLSDEELEANFKSERLFKDEAWEYGFVVNKEDQSGVAGEWRYYKRLKPLWQIGPWWTGNCLIENRLVDGDEFKLADKDGIKELKYNPEEKSLSFKLDASKVYGGRAAKGTNEELWPHLLIEQKIGDIYKELSEEDKVRYSADADKIYLEMDIRMTDFKDTTNPEGVNAVQFLSYYYLALKDVPGKMIWFGANLFDSRGAGLEKTNWQLDTASNYMIYSISTADVYGGAENSFFVDGKVVEPSEEWKHIRIDITPHIERCISIANKDLTFGKEVTIDDFYFKGCNVGFEIHGNYDCTFEIKNFNLVSYNQK